MPIEFLPERTRAFPNSFASSVAERCDAVRVQPQQSQAAARASEEDGTSNSQRRVLMRGQCLSNYGRVQKTSRLHIVTVPSGKRLLGVVDRLLRDSDAARFPNSNLRSPRASGVVACGVMRDG